MSLNLNQSNVSLTDPVFIPMLKNLQANILKGHGRNFAHHLFFQIKKNKIKEAKTWIKHFAAKTITSAKKQLEDTHQVHLGKIVDGGTIYTLSLSSAGYGILGETASQPTISTGFKVGMAARAAQLNDQPAQWDKPFTRTAHFLIIVADDNHATAQANANHIKTQVASFATLLLDQKGNVLKMKNGIGIEHFGYADGISQPLYLKDAITGQPSTSEWNDKTNLSLLLVPDPGGKEDDSFGSYFVFRKLEQNVKGFKDGEGDNAPTPGILPSVMDVSGTTNPDLPGAMIVGRFESSVPVIKHSTDIQTNPPVITNDFNYADDLTALKCPFHAHIRLMNPRKGDTVAGDVGAQRITRRGMPYDEIKRIPLDKITNITDDMLNKKQPTKGVGLLFMCYQSNIDLQFEILQGIWANTGQIKNHPINAQDSIISQGTNPHKTLPKQWGLAPQTGKFDFHGFVTNKGGEYFFTPSISFLKHI